MSLLLERHDIVQLLKESRIKRVSDSGRLRRRKLCQGTLPRIWPCSKKCHHVYLIDSYREQKNTVAWQKGLEEYEKELEEVVYEPSQRASKRSAVLLG